MGIDILELAPGSELVFDSPALEPWPGQLRGQPSASGGNHGDNPAHRVTLKSKYDPTNLFRLNANIQPG